MTATREIDGAPVIDSFDQTGAFIASFDGSDGSPDGLGFGCRPTSLAVDGSHRIYALDSCKDRVDRYAADGTFGVTVYDGSVPAPDGGSRAPAGVAVDPVSGEVYVAAPGPVGFQVTHFTVGGAAAVYTFDASSGVGVRAMAVSGVGTVYTSDSLDPVVERFVAFEGPSVATGSVSSLAARSAVLEATIDPEGVESSYHFEYGLDSYSARTDESDPVTGSGEVPATAIATGLIPNATYHFRIVGSNASGAIVGSDQTFTTAPEPPALDGLPAFASSMTTTGATLNATLNPNGSETTYRFEFGSGGPCDAHPCASTPDAGAGGGRGDQPVTADLTGLTAGTTYHYRLVGDNGTGVQEGADATFSTAPATPASAHDVGAFGADLHGVINPHGTPTSYHFDYGTTIAYGKTTPETDGGSGNGEVTVSQPTGRLTPATTYHFRVVATTNGQTTTSDDATFTTGKLPVAVVTYPTAISTTAAILAGTVDTHGSGGSYSFKVESLEGSYSATTAAQPTPTGDGMQPVTAAIAGLPAGETLRVVLSVTSNQATTSDDIVFATAPLAKPPTRPADSNTHRCTAPTLHPYPRHPQPGDTITLTGRDLGAGGTVTLAGKKISPRRWTDRRVSVLIPRGVTGALPLTIDCGNVSNAIALKIAPSNKFKITKIRVHVGTATLSLRLPKAGKVRTSGSRISLKTTRIARAGAATVRVKLTSAGASALAKSDTGRLETAIHLRYTPTGGQPNTKTTTLIFKRNRR